ALHFALLPQSSLQNTAEDGDAVQSTLLPPVAEHSAFPWQSIFPVSPEGASGFAAGVTAGDVTAGFDTGVDATLSAFAGLSAPLAAEAADSPTTWVPSSAQ